MNKCDGCGRAVNDKCVCDDCKKQVESIGLRISDVTKPTRIRGIKSNTVIFDEIPEIGQLPPINRLPEIKHSCCSG